MGFCFLRSTFSLNHSFFMKQFNLPWIFAATCVLSVTSSHGARIYSEDFETPATSSGANAASLLEQNARVLFGPVDTGGGVEFGGASRVLFFQTGVGGGDSIIALDLLNAAAAEQRYTVTLDYLSKAGQAYDQVMLISLYYSASPLAAFDRASATLIGTEQNVVVGAANALNQTFNFNLPATPAGNLFLVFEARSDAAGFQQPRFDNIRLDSVPLNSSDLDADGLPDQWETANGLNPNDNGSVLLANGPNGDPDGDGLLNLAEYNANVDSTNPRNGDSDSDGLSDRVETRTGTYTSPSNTGTFPNNADGDDDSLKDGVETATGVFVNATNTGTSPFLRDTDADTLPDGWEVRYLLNPIDPGTADVRNGTSGDPDNDNLENLAEYTNGTSPILEDTDADGLSDSVEISGNPRSNPLNPDTDGDTLSDGVEVNSTPQTNPALRDTDADGLDDNLEIAANTNPINPDSDGDTLLDGFEVRYGLNPNEDGSTSISDGPAGDPDLDGFPNSQEFAQATDPKSFTFPLIFTEDFETPATTSGTNPISLDEQNARVLFGPVDRGGGVEPGTTGSRVLFFQTGEGGSDSIIALAPGIRVVPNQKYTVAVDSPRRTNATFTGNLFASLYYSQATLNNFSTAAATRIGAPFRLEIASPMMAKQSFSVTAGGQAAGQLYLVFDAQSEAASFEQALIDNISIYGTGSSSSQITAVDVAAGTCTLSFTGRPGGRYFVTGSPDLADGFQTVIQNPSPAGAGTVAGEIVRTDPVSGQARISFAIGGQRSFFRVEPQK
jgi:Bacterial TSP3 repeat